MFSRRLIDLLKKIEEAESEKKKGNPRIRLNIEFQKDIQWWLDFASKFNGKATMVKYNFGQGPSFISDASLSGYGFHSGSDWQAGFFQSEEFPNWENYTIEGHRHWVNVNFEKTMNINVLELVPIWLAIKRFGDIWKNLHIIVYSDNTQVVNMVNKGISSNKVAMDMLRDIFWDCATGNIYLTARYLSTKDNIVCDFLSQINSDTKYSDLPCFLCCRNESGPWGIG